MGRGERDAELDGGKSESALDHGTVRIPLRNGRAPIPVVALSFQPRNDVVDNVVLDSLSVVGHVTPVHTVEVSAAHIQRIHPQSSSNVIENPLDNHHPLRPTKTPKSGV